MMMIKTILLLIPVFLITGCAHTPPYLVLEDEDIPAGRYDYLWAACLSYEIAQETDDLKQKYELLNTSSRYLHVWKHPNQYRFNTGNWSEEELTRIRAQGMPELIFLFEGDFKGSLPEEMKEEVRKALELLKNENAQQSGPAYPPQGVGSADP
jgi:hypothetical protein